MLLDGVLMLEAMAIIQGIFVEDILSICANPKQACTKLKLPYQLTHKDGTGKWPVFSQQWPRAARESPNVVEARLPVKHAQPPSDDENSVKPAWKRKSTRKAKATEIKTSDFQSQPFPMSTVSMDHHFQKIGNFLGWISKCYIDFANTTN